MRPLRALPAIAMLAVMGPAVTAQQGPSIALTKHNLSTTGPGPFKSDTEGQICVFCHAPHRSRLQVPLWNREDTTTSYLTYQSSTFQGAIGQPNGTTKLCLSCHDGTIALGNVVSLSAEIPMALGHRFLDTGPGFLGSSLRDDHPVSFDYSSSRGGSGVGYRPPSAITPPVRLDENGFVQCTSCHDPHNNALGDFLRQTDLGSAICLACHDPLDWATSAHATSPAIWNNQGLDPWPAARHDNVRDNACANCHRDHGAGRPERLLNFALEEENCLRCHNGNVAAKDIQQDVIKPWAHSPAATIDVHDPTENPNTMPRHAECQDCHSPHVVKRGTAQAPNVPGSLNGIDGINIAGTPVQPIVYGYEVCFKCHGDNHGGTVYVPRQIQQANTRLEFDQSSASFHPIAAAGVNPDVPSLLPPWTSASLMACTDCHASDNAPGWGGGGGGGARGPHGSIYRPLLGAKYSIVDGTPESTAEYALCYRCHNRSSILGDVSFDDHNKHIVEERTPCSVCHDPHGVSAGQGNPINNAHLINFDISVVTPYMGTLEYVSTGYRSGTCTLICHGKEHDNLDYHQ